MQLLGTFCKSARARSDGGFVRSGTWLWRVGLAPPARLLIPETVVNLRAVKNRVLRVFLSRRILGGLTGKPRWARGKFKKRYYRILQFTPGPWGFWGCGFQFAESGGM